jgi:hypothetical protein
MYDADGWRHEQEGMFHVPPSPLSQRRSSAPRSCLALAQNSNKWKGMVRSGISGDLKQISAHLQSLHYR